MGEYKKVKLVSRGSDTKVKSRWINQTTDNEKKFEQCIFTFNPFEKEYDWLVVIDDIPTVLSNRTELLSCPKENTILVTSEPSSITYYGESFAKQFKYLITSQNKTALPHENAMRSQTGNLWFYGREYSSIIKITELKKTKKLSTVCSSKQQGHTMHKLRFEFTKIMEERIPEIERFGKGFKWIETKAEALDEYEFHVAIENHIAPDVWTEKLADAFLGYTVPIYCGCPNVYDYFPEDSLIQIDITDIEGSIKKIKEIISIPGEYERRLPAIKEARRRVLEEYNLLAMVNEIVKSSEKNDFTPNEKIYNRRKMRTKNIFDLFRFLNWKISNFIKDNK